MHIDAIPPVANIPHGFRIVDFLRLIPGNEIQIETKLY